MIALLSRLCHSRLQIAYVQADVRWCEKVPKLLVTCRDRARLMDRVMSRLRHRHWPILHKGRRGSGGIAQSQMCPSTMRLCMPPPTSFHVHKLSCDFSSIVLCSLCSAWASFEPRSQPTLRYYSRVSFGGGSSMECMRDTLS